MDDLEKYIEKRKSQNKDFAENFDKSYENFRINELKEFDISEYLDNQEIREEYLVQVLKDGDNDEISQALKNIEKAKILKS
uniref:helix-turn-helix domain-containing transcriptional regulator n=1 Tax=Aliarcobacter sp. TaxID=2321116 RepID=UPI004048482F